jgi:hypothetical protein
MAFVPEGQADSSQARSAWLRCRETPVPEGRSKSLSVPEPLLRGVDRFVDSELAQRIAAIGPKTARRDTSRELGIWRRHVRHLFTPIHADVVAAILFNVCLSGRPAIRQLTSRRLADVVIHECWSGPCTVELRANAQAPVFRLPVLEPLEGFFWRADFTLVSGEIVYDYLGADHV